MFVTLFFFTILSLLHAKPLTNHPQTDSRRTSPTTKFLPQRTEAKSSKARANKEPEAPNTIPFPACEHNGKFYLPGEKFAEGTNGKGWCYGLYCDNDGHAISWDHFECGTSTPPSTDAITTIPPPFGCEYDGKLYFPGESFNEGNDEKGWCYGLYCTENGDIIAWDNFDCGPSTQPTTAPPFPPTTSKVTTPPQHTSSSLLPTRSEITTPRTTPPHTTFSPTSGQTTPTVPPQPQGCEYEGKFYPPGAEISRGSDGHGWCYGLYCNYDGNTVPWDDFNCGSIASPPSSTTAPPPPPTTTEQPSTPTGCTHDGKFYPPGEIRRGKSGKWCGGLI